MAFTRVQRISLALKVSDAMRVAYEEAGEEGDFEDGYRYLRDDSSDEELQAEFDKWCNNA